MEWLSVADCGDAYRFGWAIGIGSGLYAQAIIFVLIMSAPSYHPDVQRRVTDTIRKRTQWTLVVALALLFLVWALGGRYAGAAQFSCYIATLPLGVLAVVAPFLFVCMFTAAGWVGRAGPR